MEGETMEKEMINGGGSAQEYAKLPPGYHHHSQHIQRSPSMDANGHHHGMHNPQQQPQQQFAKPPHAPPSQQAHHSQQPYHGKGPGGHYHRRYDGGRGGYPPYPPHPGNPNPSHLGGHYHPHYAPHSHSHPHLRATTPRVQTVVTHSFSMEEEQREDGSSRYRGGHHHHRGQPQNQRDTGGGGSGGGCGGSSGSNNSGSYTRDEYRSPSGEFNPDRSSHQHQQRDPQDHSFQRPPPPPMPHHHHFGGRRGGGGGGGGGGDYPYGNERDLPPVLEENDIHLTPRGGMIPRSSDQDPSEREPPSPPKEGGGGAGSAVSAPVSASVSVIERSLSSVSSNGGPLKRSFWHHSRPVHAPNGNEGSMPSSSASALPSEFLPPKRSKTGESKSPRSPPREKEYIMTPRSQAAGGEHPPPPLSERQQQQQQQQQQHYNPPIHPSPSTAGPNQTEMPPLPPSSQPLPTATLPPPTSEAVEDNTVDSLVQGDEGNEPEVVETDDGTEKGDDVLCP